MPVVPERAIGALEPRPSSIFRGMRNRGVWAFIVAALLALSGGAAAEDAASTHAAQCEAVVARLR